MENTKLWVFFWQTKGPLKIHITLACLSDLPLLSVLLFMKLLLTIFLPSPCCNPGCLSFLPTILLPRPFFQNLSSLVLDCFICLTQILWEASSVTGAMKNSNSTSNKELQWSRTKKPASPALLPLSPDFYLQRHIVSGLVILCKWHIPLPPGNQT